MSRRNDASLTALNLSSLTSEDTDAVVEALGGNTVLVNLQLNLDFDPPVALIKAVAIKPMSSNSYLVALTDGADGHSKDSIQWACAAINNAADWRLFIIGLEVDDLTRAKCEQLARACQLGRARDALRALQQRRHLELLAHREHVRQRVGLLAWAEVPRTMSLRAERHKSRMSFLDARRGGVVTHTTRSEEAPSKRRYAQ